MLVVTNVRTAATLELDIDVDTLLPQDSGAREAAAVEFDLHDQALAFELLPEDEITISAVASPSDLLFGGFARSLRTDIVAIGRVYHVIAYDYSTLLDRINVVADDRAAGESDHDRLVYFMTTYGSGLFDPDDVGIATMNASMPAQKFRLLTLRQAIEQVLGTALETGTYRLNAYRKLDTWDSSPGLSAAPYDVVVGTPGVGEIAPENLSINADTSNLFNAYWVRGATAAGSGWFTDAASIAQWGRREKYIDAPDSDLSWKAYNVGHAALADTAQPKYRGTFTTDQGDWRSNQRFLLTSPMHGPAGGLVAAPFDTARISRRYLSGTALEAFDVEFGSPKGSFAAKHGKEARRADGVGPGSGGWGPGGGFGGSQGDSPSNCGCPPFIQLYCFEGSGDFDAGPGNQADGKSWVGTAVDEGSPSFVATAPGTVGQPYATYSPFAVRSWANGDAAFDERVEFYSAPMAISGTRARITGSVVASRSSGIDTSVGWSLRLGAWGGSAPIDLAPAGLELASGTLLATAGGTSAAVDVEIDWNPGDDLQLALYFTGPGASDPGRTIRLQLYPWTVEGGGLIPCSTPESGQAVDNETFSGDGTTTNFPLAFVPAPGSLKAYVAGSRTPAGYSNPNAVVSPAPAVGTDNVVFDYIVA